MSTCLERSATQILELRRTFLLHPQGFPMFQEGWRVRGRAPLTAQQMASVPRDWVVVLLSSRWSGAGILEAQRIADHLRTLFGPDRVVLHETAGNLTEGGWRGHRPRSEPGAKGLGFLSGLTFCRISVLPVSASHGTVSTMGILHAIPSVIGTMGGSNCNVRIPISSGVRRDCAVLGLSARRLRSLGSQVC